MDKHIKELANFLQDKCIELGMNVAHDYDGIENEEDVLFYTKAVIKNLENKKQEQPDTEPETKIHSMRDKENSDG